ncbi:MAG TPA: hypothetical protein VM469_04765 [Pseudoxanthomonas sp.]|nr:hypothetical protein [Pseudoxanthomonas sp.]
MRKFTNTLVLMFSAIGIVASSGCASNKVTSAEQRVDPFPWCADERRESTNHMPPPTGSSEADWKDREPFENAPVSIACQQPASPVHP